MIVFLLLIIPSLSSCSCRIWSLVFLILWFKCSILCLLFYRKKRNTLWKHWRQLRLQLLGCTAYMPTTQLKNGPQSFSEGMRMQILLLPTTVTAKPKTSRQKQNTSRQNRNPHGKTETLTAKTKYLTAKPKPSRQNQRPHGKTKYLTAKTKYLTAKANTHGKTKAILFLLWSIWFCREVFCFCREVFGFAVRHFDFAVTVVGHHKIHTKHHTHCTVYMLSERRLLPNITSESICAASTSSVPLSFSRELNVPSNF